MIIEVIDSFDTMNPPDLPNPFNGKQLTKTEKLNEDLQDVATSLISICKAKLVGNAEGIDLFELKDVAKVALDVQKAFFDNKQTNVQVNNIQNNISNSQLNHFKGIMRNEI